MRSQLTCNHPAWAAANTAANLLNEPVCAMCRVQKSEAQASCAHLVWELRGDVLICRSCETQKPIKVQTTVTTHNYAEQYVASGRCPACTKSDDVFMYPEKQGGGLFCIKCCKDFNIKGEEMEYKQGERNGQPVVVKTDPTVIPPPKEWFIHRHGLYHCCLGFIQKYVSTPSLWRQKDGIVTGERLFCPNCRGSIVYDGTKFKWGIQ